jgi:hypothetical protein
LKVFVAFVVSCLLLLMKRCVYVLNVGRNI